VGDDAEFACSEVTTAERLLHAILAPADQNMLRPIRVSLKKEMKNFLRASGFLQALSSPPAFVSSAPILG
jgi:hypothetical protein